MALVSGTQQTVVDPEVLYPGDYYGIQSGFVHEQAYLASDTITVGSFCWYAGGNLVTQGQGSSTQLAGFVVRDQDNVIPYSSTPLGYGMAIPAAQRISIARNGTFGAVITASGNGGGVINNGDAVYVHVTTGALGVGFSGNASYVQTDFVIINNAVPSEVSTNLVVMSNQVQATATQLTYGARP